MIFGCGGAVHHAKLALQAQGFKYPVAHRLETGRSDSDDDVLAGYPLLVLRLGMSTKPRFNPAATPRMSVADVLREAQR